MESPLPLKACGVFFFRKLGKMEIFDFEGGQSELGVWYPVTFEHRLLGGSGGVFPPENFEF